VGFSRLLGREAGDKLRIPAESDGFHEIINALRDGREVALDRRPRSSVVFSARAAAIASLTAASRAAVSRSRFANS
jgi:hypothetical protein